MDDGGFEDTPPLRVHAVVSVDDGTLVVDLTALGAGAVGMNVPIASTHAGAYFAVRAFLGPTVPQNAGLTGRVRVITAERAACSTRPSRPPLSARHLAVQRLTDVVVEALGELLPERAVAASQVSFPALVFQAVDPRSGRADATRRHPRRRRRRPPGRARRRRRSTPTPRTARSCRPRSPSSSTRGGSSAPSWSTARAAGARMRGGMGLRRDYAPARRPVGRHVLRRADESRRSAPAAARAAAPARPAARRYAGRARTTTSPCRARATSFCAAATCCRWSAPVAEGSARRPVRADLEGTSPSKEEP